MLGAQEKLVAEDTLVEVDIPVGETINVYVACFPLPSGLSKLTES